MCKLLLIILVIAIPFQLARAHDFEPFPIEQEILPVNNCSLKIGGTKKQNLGQRFPADEFQKNIELAFAVLVSTKFGTKLVKEFLLKQNANHIELGILNRQERRKYGLGNRVLATYLYEPEKNSRRLLVDPGLDLGLQAIYLAHEITHALDPKLELGVTKQLQAEKELQAMINLTKTDAAKRIGKGSVTDNDLNELELKKINNAYNEFYKVSDPIAFAAERLGFDGQDKFVQEVLKIWPCYARFLDRHRETNGITIHKVTTDDYIFSRYSIHPEYIGRH